MTSVYRRSQRALAEFIRDEEGLTSVEYALLMAIVVIAAIGCWLTFGRRVRRMVWLANICFYFAEWGWHP